MTGVGAKYLLVGLARCGLCGGGMLVKSREHGRKRHHRYACSSYHLRGRSVCPNHLELPLAAAEAQILEAIEVDILVPDVVDVAIAEAIEMLTAPPAPAQSADDLQRAMTGVEGELRNLTMALAAGGEMTSLVEGLREREQRRASLERQIASLTTARVVDPRRVERELRAKFSEWREMFGRHIQLSRQALQKLLTEKIVCTPKREAGRSFYELRARLSFGRIFTGILGPSGGTSPAGFEPAFWP
jgi:hypothetical protein